ncbi:MAG: type IV secretory system conjugative DNA transfer family protein [Lachnospiraceae bacterium]|nr:type IV secretory system conjugative DNA transfer family protein [Lachnospiraceae bacterium]
MRSERYSSKKEIQKVLKAGAAGPVLYCDNGNVLTHEGEGHVMYLGVSGSGKSRRGTIPATKTVILNGQSAVIVDPKGEIYANTKDMISDGYNVHIIDFRHLYDKNAEGWNPLTVPYTLWKSGTPENVDTAEQMIEDLAHTMYPVVKNSNVDPFWIQEGRNVFIGAVYGIFEAGSEDEINLASVYYFISKGDERLGGSTYLKDFVELLAENENIAMQLQSYITTAPETRGGIRSTFLDGLSIATKSTGVRNFLSHDDLNINELTGDCPTLIYIIIPDETPIYDALSGVLVSQLMYHYVRIAVQKYDGRLPVRVNVILEELGNIGRAITNLPHLMTAGRSRNIRVLFVIQSISQLTDIYGASHASTIISNCDVKVAFRVNHWDTLAEFSRLCGEREVKLNGLVQREPLITPSQIGAMETGQALVIISGRTKFITWLPDFTEMSLSSGTKRHKRKKPVRHHAEISYFDIRKYVTEKRHEKAQNALPPGIPTFDEWMKERQKEKQKPISDTDALIERIDRQIAELEAENKKEEDEGSVKDRKTPQAAKKEPVKRPAAKLKNPPSKETKKGTEEISEKPDEEDSCPRNVWILSVGDVDKTSLILRIYLRSGKARLKKNTAADAKWKYCMENLEAPRAEKMVSMLRRIAGTKAVIIDPDD